LIVSYDRTVSKKIDYDEYVAWKLDRQNVDSLDTLPAKAEACSPQNDINAQLTLNSSQNLETTTSGKRSGFSSVSHTPMYQYLYNTYPS